MDVKGIGEVVIPFAEIQRNKYWKYYYDLSLMLADDKYLVAQELRYSSDYIDYLIYDTTRYWWIDNAFIVGDEYHKYGDRGISDIYEKASYYNINPFDLEKMEYTSQKNLDRFKTNYMSRYEVRSKTFDKKRVYYDTFVLDYCTSLMEKELDELSTIFEDKKNVINLVALNDKEGMNGDLLRIIYNHLISNEGNKIYTGIIDKIEDCKNRLEMDVWIIKA
jgi:hypothetical protein